MTPQFTECDTCRAKLGSPILCSGCLANRAAIEAIKPRAADRSDWPCWPLPERRVDELTYEERLDLRNGFDANETTTGIV